MPELLTSDVWLVQSRTNPFPVQGEMAFADGMIIVTVTGGKDCTGGMRDYLAKQTGRHGIEEELARGDRVDVLAFSPADAQVSFPKTAGGYIAKIEVYGQTWFVALAYPAGGAITNLASMSKGRKVAKRWTPIFGA